MLAAAACPKRPPWRRPARGFSLVELMIVVAIIGVLAALAIYGVNRYVAAAKSSEAKNGIGGITRSAHVIFERERDTAQILGEGNNSSANIFVLCGTAQPVPLGAVPAGVKYQPSQQNNQDFKTGTGTTGWVCLNHFEISHPIYYRYTYQMGGGYLSTNLGAPDPGVNGFEAAAQGDLDGDGTIATFARTGTVNNQELLMATQVFINNEFE